MFECVYEHLLSSASDRLSYDNSMSAAPCDNERQSIDKEDVRADVHVPVALTYNPRDINIVRCC